MKNPFKILMLAMVVSIAVALVSCKKEADPDPKEKDQVSNDSTSNNPDSGSTKEIKASFKISDMKIAENSSDATSLKISFSSSLTKDEKIVVRVAGTAKAGEDYSVEPAIVDGKITVSAAKGASEASFSIKSINNDKVEDDKTIEFSLVASGDIKLGENTKSIVTITNDDKEPEVVYGKISDLKTKTEITEETKIRAKVIGFAFGDPKSEFMIHDGTAGIVLSLVYNNDYKVGDELEITLLKGIKISNNNSTTLNRVFNENVKKVSSSITLTTKNVTLSQLYDKVNEGVLVKITDVFFKEANEDKTFGERSTISTCGTGDEVDFYVIGDDFKKIKMPKGKSSIVGVPYKLYKKQMLYINKFSDIESSETVCSVDVKRINNFPYNEGFEDGLGSFYQYNKKGKVARWTTYNDSQSKNKSAYIDGLDDTFTLKVEESEDWLISPALDLKGKTEAMVNFFTKVNQGYRGSGLTVKISTNYNNGDPAKATWETLEGAKVHHYIGGGNATNDFTSSGDVSLAKYLVDGVRIAFVYTSTDRTAYKWKVDNFKVEAK